MINSEFDYKQYWENIYKYNGTSGAGSYGILAEFKGEVVNSIIDEFQIYDTIEFGCGDGNQIKYMNYKKYTGFDVAPSSVSRCKNLYSSDSSKEFILYDPITFDNSGYSAHMVVCLDVLYHVTIEEDFIKTLDHIFSCAEKVVVIYTAIVSEDHPTIISGIKHRNVMPYLAKYTDFKIKEIIPQKYPSLSCASFIILTRV